ncbi:MAG: ComF family protein, partial [Ilumatobacteraceae bacterium]
PRPRGGRTAAQRTISDQSRMTKPDQAGEDLGLELRRLLTREEHSGPQTGRSRSERLQAPGFRARLDRPGRSVLLVDDIATTGATLGSASAALRSVGASNVLSVAVAGTPVRTRRRPTGQRRHIKQAA